MFLIDIRLKKCVKAINTYSFLFDSAPDRCKSQEMCIKAVDDYANTLEIVPDRYKTQEKCDKAISENPFMLKYFHDKYKTQQICDEVVDDFLKALKFVLDWFVISKMIKKLSTALYADDGLLFFDEDSGSNVTFCCNEMGILSVNLNNINLDDTKYEEDDPDTIILVRLGILNLKNAKHLKKDK